MVFGLTDNAVFVLTGHKGSPLLSTSLVALGTVLLVVRVYLYDCLHSLHCYLHSLHCYLHLP